MTGDLGLFCLIVLLRLRHLERYAAARRRALFKSQRVQIKFQLHIFAIAELIRFQKNDLNTLYPHDAWEDVQRLRHAWVRYGVNIPCASVWDFAVETMPALNEAVTGLLTELDITYTS